MKEIIKLQYKRFLNQENHGYCNIDEVDSNNLTYSYNGKEKVKSIFNQKNFDTKEETFVKEFGNPLYSVNKEYFMVVLEKREDKVSLKYFIGSKSRGVGKSWFKTSKNVYFLTVNTETGDVYHGNIIGYQRKKCVKKITRNYFLSDPLNLMKTAIKHFLTAFTNRDGDSYTVTMDIISKFMYEIDQRQDFGDLNFSQRLYRFYLNKKGIKYPDNFWAYLTTQDKLPILKNFKKEGKKFVDAFMKLNNVNGKKLRKVLHTCTSVNLSVYRIAISFFGEDWINQDETLLRACVNSAYRPYFTTETALREVFSPEELKRVFALFKQTFVQETLDYSTYFDHIRMYIELKAFGEEELRWYSCDDREEFRKEHLDWTDKLQHYKDGTYLRIYPEYMYEVINRPMTVGMDTYYPVLLTNSMVYNQESQLQSNCVKGYIGKTSSIIVSLRKGSIDSDVRGTIEYSLTKKNDEIHVNRVQYLGRFNQRLGEEWDVALNRLDYVMSKCIDDERYENVKLKKECANGVILDSDSEWNEWGKLQWTYKNIEIMTYINNVYNLNI